MRVLFQRLFGSATIYQVAKLLPSPRFFKSHLPDHLIPPDVFTKKAKIVYVARNPKDLAVSYYYFCRWQPMMPKFETWDKFFDAFMKGRGEYAVSSCQSKCLQMGTRTKDSFFSCLVFTHRADIETTFYRKVIHLCIQITEKKNRRISIILLTYRIVLLLTDGKLTKSTTQFTTIGIESSV